MRQVTAAETTKLETGVEKNCRRLRKSKPRELGTATGAHVKLSRDQD